MIDNVTSALNDEHAMKNAKPEGESELLNKLLTTPEMRLGAQKTTGFSEAKHNNEIESDTLTLRAKQIELRINALLEEYKAIKEDSIFHGNAIRQVVSLTITAAGVFLAGLPYIAQSNFQILLLVIPLLFYVLAWIQLRSAISINKLTHYISGKLAPRFGGLIQELHPDPDYNQMHDKYFQWENYNTKIELSYNIILFPMIGSTYGINIIIPAISLVSFFISRQVISSLTTLEIMLVFVNAILLIYTISLLFWSRRSFFKYQQ